MNLTRVQRLVWYLLLLTHQQTLCQFVMLLGCHCTDPQLLIQEVFCCEDTAIKSQVGAQAFQCIISDGHSPWD